MVAESLISDMLAPLRTSTTGDEALALMSEYSIKHLPIVNNQQLLGLVSEDDILENDAMEAVGSYNLSVTKPYVRKKDHIYEVMRLLAEYRLTVIPVVDETDVYLGMITLEDILFYFANTGSFTETGSIIVLEMQKRDYALSEIARITEGEGAIILSSFVTAQPTNETIQVTLKINKQSIQSVLETFERFKYEVKASFNEETYLNSLKERYDILMNYLNV